MQGNLHAPFGKRTTEKDLHHRHLAGAPLHSAGGPRKRTPPGTSPRGRPYPKPGDSFREPAFSKERRLEPQITGGGCSPTRPGCR